MAQRAESPADVTRRAVLFGRVMTVGRRSRACYAPEHPAVDSSDLSGVECATLRHDSFEHDLKQLRTIGEIFETPSSDTNDHDARGDFNRAVVEAFYCPEVGIEPLTSL